MTDMLIFGTIYKLNRRGRRRRVANVQQRQFPRRRQLGLPINVRPDDNETRTGIAKLANIPAVPEYSSTEGNSCDRVVV